MSTRLERRETLEECKTRRQGERLEEYKVRKQSERLDEYKVRKEGNVRGVQD